MKLKHLLIIGAAGVGFALGCSDSGNSPTNSGGGSTPALSISDGTAIEGGTITFTVTQSASSSEDVSFSYATVPGTATVSNFTATSGKDTITAGATSITIQVSTTDDAEINEARTMSLQISSPANATISKSSGQGTIWDNDGSRFSTDVQPIIQTAGCLAAGCHGGSSVSGGMNLGSATYAQVLAASGTHGKIVMAGDASSSNMYLKVTDTPPFGARMPFGGPYLSTTQINLIRDWIDQGAQNN